MSKSRIFIAALLVIITSARSAMAGDVAGAGPQPCTYAAQIDNNPEAQWLLSQWVLGYFSGLNFAMHVFERERKDLDGLAPTVIFQLIKNGCGRDGRHTVLAVANRIYQQLPPLRRALPN